MDRNIIAALGLAPFEKGWVWLVGAGPGDPGLITALGLKALSEADFILYDALVDERLLSLARKGAGLIFAGKRAGVTSCKQSDISNLLIDLAKKGGRVLRLKGGDPFVFGRGGEEAGALASARVPFRIVPGITAGIGGLAYAGIPVTHRDTNHAVTFITGHGSDGKLPRLDWQAIGKGSETLVFYMARKFASEIASALMAAGRSPDEPAAIVANAARDNQSVTVTTLGGLAAAAEKAPSLSIIVIGENVRLREQLAWLGKMAAALNPA
ncbi:MAG TPA: uroporphyrinogen-III C-methyltransferase [Rhizomicrobium sp.]|jgi:uroporphyrin-III C-methyltransferase|nr:uroporphyrinogen-III C-methyltransferase [Rhizomicrobium sp.]